MDEKLLMTAIQIAGILEPSPCQRPEHGRYVIVRTYSAGVFAGELEGRNGQEVVLRNARRLMSDI